MVNLKKEVILWCLKRIISSCTKNINLMKYILSFTLLLYNLFLVAQHPNVLIGNTNSPEEPTIVVNPYNTNEMIAGANLNSYYFSSDAGLTWQSGTMTSQYTVWGDPCVAVDTAGDFYFFHLAYHNGVFIDRIVCEKSTDSGATWSGSGYMGLNGTKAQDKEWVSIDRANNNIYVTWTQFDAYGSSASTDSSTIWFSKSTDAGQSWTQAIRLNKEAGDCIDSDNTVEGAVPAVGVNGEVYVAWVGTNGIIFDRSLDYGSTWLEDDILVTSVPGGWDYAIPGIFRSNGLPITVCDTSGGANNGTIYINWSDQRNGIDDTDVWLCKSIDGGNTWSSPIRVNDDLPGKQQFLTWMAIDQVTGKLWFVFYDRRNYSDEQTDVYCAVSEDGGNTFTNFKISESPFNPVSTVFFGDYTNITAYNNVVRPIWARLDGNSLSVWTSIINSTIVGVDNVENENTFSLEQNYPNPFDGKTYFKFKTPTQSKINLSVIDIYGRQVANLINNKTYPAGKHIISFNAKEYNLSSGIYYYSLISNKSHIVKMMTLQ